MLSCVLCVWRVAGGVRVESRKYSCSFLQTPCYFIFSMYFTLAIIIILLLFFIYDISFIQFYSLYSLKKMKKIVIQTPNRHNIIIIIIFCMLIKLFFFVSRIVIWFCVCLFPKEFFIENAILFLCVYLRLYMR